MTHPIIAGVDESDPGAWAAATAWRVASAAGTTCIPVHAVRETRIPPGQVPGVPDTTAFRREVLRLTRDRLLESLRDAVPDACLDTLEVRVGAPARVLTGVAAERGAGLIVVGGKRHTAVGRWLAGSTAHQTVRITEVPTLVATTSAAGVERVLAAVDLSPAAEQTIDAAQRYAALFEARLRVIHVIEPLPFASELRRFVDQAAYVDAATSVIEESLWPQVCFPDAERVVRHGWARRAIEVEAAKWDADVVVVGSHGRSRLDRVLLGSVTEGLLNDLPASLLVVPLQAAPERTGDRTAASQARTSV